MKNANRASASIVFASIFLCVCPYLSAQSGIYDRTGVIAGHGSYTSLPFESVDLFTGNLTLRYLDVYLPGPNGLDVEVWRVYNSKVLKDRQAGQAASVQAEHKSWVGMGWTMHMGRVYDPDGSNPVIEFPDGRRESLYTDNYGTGKHISREFLKYDKPNRKLYFKNGVVWTFGVPTTVYFGDGTSKPTRVVTEIRNPFDHFITISYVKVGSSTYRPTISKITDSMGREITFVSTTETFRKLQQIKVKDCQGNEVIHSYSVGTFPNGNYKLQSVTPPGLPATSYLYHDGSNNRYELTKVTTTYGGVLEYAYANHDFYFNTTCLDSRVVVQKKITFNPGETPIWDYTYPSYSGVTYGTAAVEGPEYTTSFTHHAYDASCPWKIGLIKEWGYGDGSRSEAYEWTFQEISSQTWTVLGTNMGTAKGPLPASVTESRTGDAGLKTELLYERTDPKRYGLPTRINVYPDGAANPRSYSELSYFFESSNDFRSKYMFAFVSEETQRAGSGALMKRAQTSYYEGTGKWGALKQVKRYRSESSWLTWDYDYICSNPSEVIILAKQPGVSEYEWIYYKHGVRQKVVSASGGTMVERQISPYNSAVLSEENAYEGTMSYTYDSAGRVIAIHMPQPFNAIGMAWRPNGENKVVITRGGNTVTKYWDGMGRELGHTETGGDTTLYYLKILDAEGRLKEENAGSTHPDDPKYAYILDNAGRVTSITDPMQKTSTISYAGIRKTVTDPELRPTHYDHEDLPGLPTKVTDALGREAVHTYDALGRLVGVVFNGARTHSYEYNWLDNVLSETHPETGTIRYDYKEDNGKLWKKIWQGDGDSRQEYEYIGGSGQLGQFRIYKDDIRDETITYSYHSAGSVASVSSSKNWSRSLSYNIWGSVASESVTIPGLGTKTIAYDYDGNNNQNKITYPDGRIALTGHNTLNMPQTVAFNGKSIVDSTVYGPNKMPTAISVAGNGTGFSASYTSSGLLSATSLTRGAATLSDASYSYDGAGNITGITSTAPAPALSASFGYDALNRLVSASYTTGRVGSYAYEYDAYGNLTKVKENGADVFTKAYDGQNRIVGQAYDLRGNIASSGGKLYDWDSLNRLRSIRNGSGQTVGYYLYDDRGLRLRAAPPLPEIDVYQDAIPDPIPVPDGGISAFKIVSQEDRTFIVRNSGTATLTLGQVQISGQHANQFQVLQQPASTVPPNDQTTFTIRFQPSDPNYKEAALSLPSDDLDEDPYNITLFGNYEPEINIEEAPDGGSVDFGSVRMYDFVRRTFTVKNLGHETLILSGSPIVTITGPDWDQFSVEQQPAASVPPNGGTTTFIIQFMPTSLGPKTAHISIANNDTDENPYDITLLGTGLDFGPLKIIKSGSQMRVTSPEGDTRLRAGSLQTITWEGGEEAPYVRVEYSTDNGGTYRTIAARAPNDGRLDWLVPPELSSSSLIRVSDAEGAPVQTPEAVTFEFSFKVSSPMELYAPVPGFEVELAVPDFRLQSRASLRLEVISDQTKKQVYVAANDFWSAPLAWDVFLDRWHRVRVEFDAGSGTASVWMDNEPVPGTVGLECRPIEAAYGTFTVSSEARAGATVRIEDVEVRIAAPQAGEPRAAAGRVRLFLDDFESYGEAEEYLRHGGWVSLLSSADKGESIISRPLNRLLSEYWAPRAGKDEKGDFAVDEGDSVSGVRSLRMEKAQNGPTVMTKIFSLPLRAPFAVSERPFAVVDSEADSGPIRREDSGSLRRSGDLTRASGEAASPLNPGIKVAGQEGASGGEMGVLSVSPTGTYYIYSFDGRLVAEYNGLGICVRDYIYMGGKLIAEYRPQENSYFYYATDQIGSTRIVTDDTGAVVYAAAHDPYGGIQKTWTTAYDPALKFSGKERDTESGLDYFGARYYDHSLYRFLSVDPIIPAGKAVFNPQRWNLYAYCLGNPVNYVDPDGRYGKYVHWDFTFAIALKVGLPQSLAIVIADANQGMDENLRTSSVNPFGFGFHFPSDSMLSVAYDVAFSTYDPVVLGRALHIIQDSFSHRGMGWHTGGHILDSMLSPLFPSFDVDDPFATFADMEVFHYMAEITEIIMQEYARRLTMLMFVIGTTTLSLCL